MFSFLHSYVAFDTSTWCRAAETKAEIASGTASGTAEGNAAKGAAAGTVAGTAETAGAEEENHEPKEKIRKQS